MLTYKFCLIFSLGIFLQNSVLCENDKSSVTVQHSPFHHEVAKNQLDKVQLNHQNISQITEDLLWEIIKVQKLEIEHSNVRSIEPNAFKRLTKLKKLSLKHNLLEEIKNNIFNQNIEELDLSDNQIRTIETDAFTNMWELKSLKLENNKLEIYDNGWFRMNPKLCYINFAHNLIKSISEFRTAFRYKTCEVDLILSHNSIEEVSEGAFWHWWSYNKLYLDHNAISAIGNYSFSAKWIRDLRLDHNRIVCTTVDITHVEKINVDYNPWDEQCLIDFLQQKNVDLASVKRLTTLSPMGPTTKSSLRGFV